MGAKPGTNNGVVGKKGRSGRKSAYQEQADAKMLWEMFFGKMDKAEVKKKLDSGVFSLKDAFMAKAFAGNERILVEIFKKLFPDKQETDLKGGLTIKLVDYGTEESISSKGVPKKLASDQGGQAT